MMNDSGFNLAEVNEAVAEAIPDRPCIVFRDRRYSYAEIAERSRRLANALVELGVRGVRTERTGFAPYESHLPHAALYLYNGNEYLETMLAAFKARVVPLNVNYRYVADELEYLFRDSDPVLIVYDAAFRARLEDVLPRLPGRPALIEVGDAPGEPLEGALAYEALIADASADLPATAADWSPDDLYLLYTGGTTGMPKGVLWRQDDIFRGALDGFRPHEAQSLAEVVGAARRRVGRRMMPLPPFMHGAGHWTAFWAFHMGDTVVIQNVVEHLDAHDALEVAARERVGLIVIVGDAFARPLIDALDTPGCDLSALRVVLNSAAALSARSRVRLLDRLPHVRIADGVGSSESGGQLQQESASSGWPTRFRPGPYTRVLSDDRATILEPGDEAPGWLAKTGPLPLGYLGDPKKTAATFITVAGHRWVVAGDRAIHHADGLIELLGRDSVTINTGGEKVFAEEVEAALRHHPAVRDVVVCGRASERWGQEVVAVVQLEPGFAATNGTDRDVERTLLATAAAHLARYKLPKAFVFVDRVVRSPSGKPDYQWAALQVAT